MIRRGHGWRGEASPFPCFIINYYGYKNPTRKFHFINPADRKILIFFFFFYPLQIYDYKALDKRQATNPRLK